MKQRSDYLQSTIWLAVAVCLLAGGLARADFFFGEPVNLGSTINGSAHDLSPCLSADGRTLFFSSDRGGGSGSFDLWVANRESIQAEWGVPQNLGATVNSAAIDIEPCLSYDGLELYFESRRAGGSGGGDIWVTTRESTENDWGVPVNLGSDMNRDGGDGPGSISPDGLELYLHSSRVGHNMDLYVTRRATKSDAWGLPVSLGAVVNTAAHEWCPTISPDGLVLLFGRGLEEDGHIWMSTRRTILDLWSDPVRLPEPFDGAFSQLDTEIAASGLEVFIDSDRPGGQGLSDLWQAPIIPVADFNGDGEIDGDDVGTMVDQWGTNDSSCDIGPMPWGDGIVDAEDLNVLAEYVHVAGPVVIHEPSSGTTDVPRDVVLNWVPGAFAETHDVYFGTVFDDVKAASADNPLEVLVSQRQAANTYAPAGLLAFGQTYYWRVDEVSASPESTIHKGFVWRFRTEPMSYALANVTATSNATAKEGEGPENTVNGSGLNADDEHSTAPADMWLGAPIGAEPVYIQYEFDKIYKLHEMWVWNYNVQFELALGFGLKDVTVECSQNGTDWTVVDDAELAQATATATYAPNTVVDLGGVAARYVRLTVSSGWGVMGHFGLSEVRFFQIPTRARKPEPADGETGVSPDTILSWRAGRGAISHEVYFSTDRQAVIDGTAPVDTATENSYLPGPLDSGQTYYWRINEINEAGAVSVWEGDIWEFTTAE